MDVERRDFASSSSLSIKEPSFSRTNSCFSDDLYMSVCESPAPESDPDPDCDFLSLSSRHINSSNDPDSSFVSATDSFTNHEVALESGDDQLAKEVADDPFLSSFKHLLAPFEPPQLIGALPKWNECQDKIRQLRRKDLTESKCLEESNMGIYGSELALRVIEEVRWYNEISKDPELSRLVNALDPDFPLAMLQSSTSGEDFNIGTPCSSMRSRASSFCIDPPASAMAQEKKIQSRYEGVDEFVLRRKLDPSWHRIAANAIARAFSRSPIRDGRVLLWVQDLVNNMEQAISLPLSIKNSSEILVGDTIVHLRGTSDWAPPRDAWIFTPIKAKDPKALLELQHYKCAGCGLKIEQEYVKRVRLCEYYGKMFCHGCHDGSKFIIPAKILKFWNFTEAPVSDRARRFLTDAKDQPAIHLSTVEPALVQKITALKKTITLREKLGHMWEFIKHCEIADETVTGHGNLTTLFNHLEKHLLTSKDVFSLSDLTRVHNKDLLNHLEPIVYYAKCHIENCENCRNHAFVCWLCGDATDLLFPFQLDKIHRCDGCGSLAHKVCVAKRVKLKGKLDCTKCERCEKQRHDRQRIASISAD